MTVQDAWMHYGFFFLKTITVLGAALVVLKASGQQKKIKASGVQFKILNKDRQQQRLNLLKAIYPDRKLRKKRLKQLEDPTKAKSPKSKLFLLSFKGDMKASQVDVLRAQISAIIDVAEPTDRVALKLESPGGMVSAYGLAASQLARFKAHNIGLTVAIDQVAASGGYMMACVADHIIAAPFALIGSIGVILQQPNFHALLKKHHIDFEQLTAGPYKRTLSTFGKNTQQGREKAVAQLEDIHALFQNHIRDHRPQLDVAAVATGEVWLGRQALERKLIDKLQTSDDMIMQHLLTHQVVQVTSPDNTPKLQKLLKKTTHHLIQLIQPNLLS